MEELAVQNVLYIKWI